MTRDQLDASVNDPWTRTMVGFGVGAADAAPAAPNMTRAARRPAIQMRMTRNMVLPFKERGGNCTLNDLAGRFRSHPGAPWNAPGSRAQPPLRNATTWSPNCS